jgi:hypothetical protein
VTEEAERSARGVLGELEQRPATHDLDQMIASFTDDVVLIGGRRTSIVPRRSPISS